MRSRFSILTPAWLVHIALLLSGCVGGVADGENPGPPGAGGNGGEPTPGAGGAFAPGEPTGGQAAGGTSGVGGQVVDSGGTSSDGGLQGSGGTLASGGVGAGGSGSGGSASGGSPSGAGGHGSGCNVEPANPSSNQTVRNLLCYVHNVYGEKVLSGQQDCHWSASSDVEYVAARTGGKYPAIVGGDFLYDNAVSQATQAWNAGGLSMIRYHMGRPLDA